MGLDLSHPLLVKRRWKLDAVAAYHKKKSNTDFAGVPLSDIKARCYIFGFDFHSYDDNGTWESYHRFTHGHSFNYGAGVDDRHFFKYYFGVTRLHRLSNKFIAIFRGSAQWADSHLLPSFEQFQIGGQSTVRGYSEGALIGDKGYTLSAEFIFPLPFLEKRVFNISFKDKIKGVTFIDHGGAVPYRPNEDSPRRDDFITGIGFGVTFNLSKYFTGRLNLGIPLRDVGERDYKDVRFHFYLQSDLI
jgi:hemolysin activation/secretion protein